MINYSNLMTNNLGAPASTSAPANGPGGNPIVPVPATPNQWPKMLIAIAVGASGIWLISTMFSEDAAKWTALITLGGIVTYYETHGNKAFSQGLKDFTGAIPGW